MYPSNPHTSGLNQHNQNKTTAWPHLHNPARSLHSHSTAIRAHRSKSPQHRQITTAAWPYQHTIYTTISICHGHVIATALHQPSHTREAGQWAERVACDHHRLQLAQHGHSTTTAQPRNDHHTITWPSPRVQVDGAERAACDHHGLELGEDGLHCQAGIQAGQLAVQQESREAGKVGA